MGEDWLPMSQPKPILSTYLHKKGVYNTSWKRRYFVLYDDRTMDYFKDKAHSMRRKKAKGTIDLTHVKRVELMQHATTKPVHMPPQYNTPHSDVISSIHPPPSYCDIVQSEPIQSIASDDVDACAFPPTLKTCDRPFSFTLISNSREWVLCAESKAELKQWIDTLTTLCQGDAIFDGYLHDNHSSKRFILYQNKVLNCYKNKKIECSLDFTRILYLKYDRNVSIDIVLSTNKDKLISLTAPNRLNAHEWYQKMISLFDKKEIIRGSYSALSDCIHFVHDKKNLYNRHIALYGEYIVLFNDESQCEAIKDMLFTDRRLFREYLIEQKCILIPVNENIKVRKASKSHGPNAFMLSNRRGDRKWYIGVETKQVLKQFMDSLKARQHKLRVVSLKQFQCASPVPKESFSVQNKSDTAPVVDQTLRLMIPQATTLRACKSLPAILEGTSSP
eukprot:925128_1